MAIGLAVHRRVPIRIAMAIDLAVHFRTTRSGRNLAYTAVDSPCILADRFTEWHLASAGQHILEYGRCRGGCRASVKLEQREGVEIGVGFLRLNTRRYQAHC
jgi:hypothetical protein